MKRYLCSLLAVLLLISPAIAGRPILLVTPQGVYQAEVVNGVPGPWVAQDIDVIVQGFTPGTPVPPDTPDVPVPPTEDPIVNQIAAISAGLKDKSEATAVAALVNSLSKMGLSGDNLKQAMEMAAPILDTSLSSGDRVEKWVRLATAITTDAAKLKAGLVKKWGVDPNSLESIHAAATQDAAAAVPAEALDFVAIINIIRMIIELLKNLGILQ